MDAKVLKAGGMLEDGAVVEYIVPRSQCEGMTSGCRPRLTRAAPEGEPTVISLPNGCLSKKTVTIPAGKTSLTDEGAEVLVHGSVSPLFSVAAGGALAIQTTGEDELLTAFRGQGFGRSVGHGCQLPRHLLCTAASSRASGIRRGKRRHPGNGSQAKFYMDGGVIEKTTITNGTITAPVTVGSRAYFSFTGGVIRDNVSTATGSSSAGGVVVYGWNDGDTSVMEMSGSAAIVDNYAYDGGGLYSAATSVQA